MDKWRSFYEPRITFNDFCEWLHDLSFGQKSGMVTVEIEQKERYRFVISWQVSQPEVPECFRSNTHIVSNRSSTRVYKSIHAVVGSLTPIVVPGKTEEYGSIDIQWIGPT